ncbi:MAG: carbamoyltransferase HypF [Chloroflexota bacterium]|nr:carbamoyltransferase HypF [Chloroflexota bacterium]
MPAIQGLRIHINGIVQGVGFRPFVYGLAISLELAGWVRNTSAGVDIEVEGDETQLRAFSRALSEDAPPLAQIDSLERESYAPAGFTTFEIVHSRALPGAFQPISPDVSVCDDCLRELFDPSNFRYRYPFINCTNCGPRFTIIKDVPYDRPKTTMSPFPMCPTCAGEYKDPLDRRFHAQPVACPDCGPHVWLEFGDQKTVGDDAILQVQELLSAGKILAIKGIGGFHLACDAENAQAVALLRERKKRPSKPLALMMPNIETVKHYCHLNAQERDTLTSRERPIVLLAKRADSTISSQIAPGQNTLGVMLPYTPLHYLLFAQGERYPAPDLPYSALVMTSGNWSGEPIVTQNEDAREHLIHIADAFLFHNREIHVHCDDSVTRVANAHPYPLRRSRGYAPSPVLLSAAAPSLLATGAELKNTFCLTKDRYAFLGQHIGNLENYETLRTFERSITHFERLFRAKPEAIACDLHPNYLASNYARERAQRENLPLFEIQHHHAHIAACLAENNYPAEEPVIGVAFDGTGYGDDGAIWGGEFLIADYGGYHRAYHLDYVPLPGGDKAVREPWRVALATLHVLGLDWNPNLVPVLYAQRLGVDNPDYPPLKILRRQLEEEINTPPTSSAGRLFDAVSALLGVCEKISYEAQAAIELEALADTDEEGLYPFGISSQKTGARPPRFELQKPRRSQAIKDIRANSFGSKNSDIIGIAPAIQAILSDLERGVPVPLISARFHNGLAKMVRDVCRKLRTEHNINTVALSGGVWQNTTLLERAISLLQEDDFNIYTHHKVPANDGGLALGQAVIAQQKLIS